MTLAHTDSEYRYYQRKIASCIKLARQCSRDSWQCIGVESARNLTEYKRISNECMNDAREYKKILVIEN